MAASEKRGARVMNQIRTDRDFDGWGRWEHGETTPRNCDWLGCQFKIDSRRYKE
jgi:hypothetical protein